MPDDPVITPRRRRSSRIPSPVDMIMERNATEARKIAVLEYVATQLAECNARLASVGIEVRPAATPRATPQATNGNGNGHVQPRIIANPCTWCGQPAQPFNVGGGVVQYLCRAHRVYVNAQSVGEGGDSAKARAVGMSVDSTEPTYNPIQQPKMGAGKMVMQPIEADYAAAKQPVTTGEADEIPFEEMPDANEPDA